MATINPLLLTQLVNENVRVPASWALDGNGDPVATFSPALTAAEQTAYNDCVAMARTPFTAGLTFAEYQALKPFLGTERSFVQMSQSEFIALTQNARDRLLFDTLTAVIRVQRLMMRDG